MSNTLNIIHLRKELFEPNSVEWNESLFREENIKKQVVENNIQEYKVWDGIIVLQLPFMGISMSHKQIVRDAKDKGLKKVFIAEDDLLFTSVGSWQYYLDNEPESWDLYLSSVYDATIENNRILFGFSALTCYGVHERFYEDFLAMKSMNNIDRELGRFSYKYEYIVCPEFCTKHSPGYSYHQGKNIPDYEKYHEGKKFFGINS